MTRNKWLIFVAVCAVIFGVLILNSKNNDVDVSKIDASKVITDKKPLPDHMFGSKAKKTVLIEYGDFQCTGCGSLYPVLHPLKEHYKEQLTFVFREFPLTGNHPNALAAAAAAEAAGLQGKFWEMHDILFENQAEWSALDSSKRTDQFVTYAKLLKLDTKKFKTNLDNPKTAQKIKKDQALGKKIGASATPTLMLDGKALTRDQWETPEKFEATLRAAIQSSGQILPEKQSQD